MPVDYRTLIKGDKVLYNKHCTLTKLNTPRFGPYEVTKTQTNGTIRILSGPVAEMAKMWTRTAPLRTQRRQLGKRM